MPNGFEDRTTNIFVSSDAVPAKLNFNIARDKTKEDETLQNYVTRQIGLLKQNMAGYKLQSRSETTLSHGDNAMAGEQIEATYKSGAQTIYQRQAAFLIAPDRALIFSASSAKVFDDHLQQLWADWLASFSSASSDPISSDQ